MPPCEAQSKGYPMQAAASPSLAPRPFLMLLGLGAVAAAPRGCITNPSCPELSPPTHLHHASPWAHPRRGGTRTRGRRLHPASSTLLLPSFHALQHRQGTSTSLPIWKGFFLPRSAFSLEGRRVSPPLCSVTSQGQLEAGRRTAVWDSGSGTPLHGLSAPAVPESSSAALPLHGERKQLQEPRSSGVLASGFLCFHKLLRAPKTSVHPGHVSVSTLPKLKLGL